MTEDPTAQTGPPERTVSLEIPAELGFVSLARVTAASLAADLDPAIDEVEDLRVAVNELVGILVEAAEAGTIGIHMWTDEAAIHVSGRCLGEWAPTEPDQLALRILEATVDEHEIGAGAFHMLKRLSAE